MKGEIALDKEKLIEKIADSLAYGDSSHHHDTLRDILQTLIPGEDYAIMSYEDILDKAQKGGYNTKETN